MAVKVTTRVRKGAVNLHKDAGEYLACNVVAEGANPAFTQACEHRVIVQSDQFPGHPKQSYDWPVKQFDAPLNTPDSYAVSFLFIAVVKYTLKIEKRDSHGSVVDVVQDLDLESTDPTDRHHEPLMVVLK